MNNNRKKKILILSFLGISLFFIAAFIQTDNSLNDVKIVNRDIIQTDEGNTVGHLKASGYESPIEINGSATGVGAHNWTWAQAQPWCTGSGTEIDPYIIEDIIINGVGSNQCIGIYESNEYFIIRNCTFYNSRGTAATDSGIKLLEVTNGKILNSYCLNNTVGIYLFESSYNTIAENSLYNNSYYGIQLYDSSSYNTISDNTMNNNYIHGLTFSTSEPLTKRCTYNTIIKNNLSYNENKGILLHYSDNNNITENLISFNEVEGMYIKWSNANDVYKNYFLNNTHHAEDEEHFTFPSINYWNNTVIGNYWDNHTTGDADGDGIDDTDYTYIRGAADPVDHLPIYGNPFHDGGKLHIDGNQASGNKSWIWSSTRAWCSGSGTSGDPYIISDLIIDAANDGSCILIGNSSVYFTIENSKLLNSGSGSMDAGIKLDSVDNALLSGNNCSNNQCGISLYLSDNNDIIENTLHENYYGVCLNDSDTNTISENTFVDNTEYALEENSVGNTFENNYCIPPITITNVTSTNDNGTYRFGDTIEITIEFSDIVYVTGTPQLTLETGDSDAVVDYTSGDATNILSFNYTVALDHNSTDLDYISTSALDLNSGTIKGIVGNDADITLPVPGSPESLGGNKDIIVDARTPSVNDVSSTKPDITPYTTGEVIDITVTFSEPVFVTGTPTLTLETNSIPDGIAYYTSGNETATLTFTYTVASGHYSSDLDYDSTNALTGIIKDSDELVADLTLPVPGTAGSLGDNKDLLIDTIDPSSPSGLAAVPSSWTNTNDFDLSWSNPADLSGIAGAYYILDTAPTSDTDGTYQAGVDITSITGITVGSEGAHTVYVWLRDAAGNVDYTTYDSVVLSLDTTDPTSPGGLAAVPSSWTNTNDFDLSWANPSELSGIAGAYYKLDSAPTSDTDGTYQAGAGITSITGITVGSDGTHNIYVWLRDVAGNVDYNTYVSVELYLDTTDPSSPSGLAAVPSSWTNTDDFDLSWSNPADLSGIAGAYYKLDSTPNSDTDGTYQVGAGITSITGITVGSDGAHTVYVWLRDAVGNVDYNTYVSVELYLDTTDPISPGGLAAVPSSWTNTDDFDLSWANPSEMSGIAGAYYKLDSAPTSDTDGTYQAGAGITSITGITVGSDGTHNIYVWLRDVAGNVDYNTYVSVELYLDTTDPSSPSGLAADPSSWTSTDDFDLSWSNPADLSGIAGAYYKLDSAPTSDTDGTYQAGVDITSITGISVGSEGTHNIYVWLRDSAGNVYYTNYASTQLYLDITDPSVLNVSSSNSDGSYGTGEIIDIMVTFSEPVFVTGIPQLILETGSTDAVISYTSGNETDTLIFTYTVIIGHNSSDLDYFSTNALSGTIKDFVGNDADRTLASLGALGSLGYNKDIIIETTPPEVTNVSSSKPDGSYGTGEIIDIMVTFSEPVFVTGIPQLTLETGSIDAVINYISGSGTDTLTFSYIVASGHTTSDLGYESMNALSLNGGTIRDLAGNGANVTLPTPGSLGSLSDNKDITLETISPTITNVSSSKPDGTYGVGEIINITITFSESVYVTGTPQLTLETGSVDAIIDYTSGSGTTTLVFTYVVASGDISGDLGYESVNALSLNGGSIKDSVGNDAVLMLPTPGTADSLSFNKNLIIDTVVEQEPDIFIWIVTIGSASVIGFAVIIILVIRKRRKA